VGPHKAVRWGWCDNARRPNAGNVPKVVDAERLGIGTFRHSEARIQSVRIADKGPVFVSCRDANDRGVPVDAGNEASVTDRERKGAGASWHPEAKEAVYRAIPGKIWTQGLSDAKYWVDQAEE
jgi:hypothetical protein